MWEAEQIRLTVFASDTGTLGLASWSQLTGAAPTQLINRPAEKVLQESGAYKSFNLVISTGANRADLLLNPLVQPTSTPPPVFTVGPLKDGLTDLIELAKKWLNAQRDVQRLAVGSVVGETAPSASAAVDLITKKLTSFKRDNSPLSDFFLQVNRPRTSKVDGGIVINRLSKWQAVQLQMLPIATAGVPAAPATASAVFDRAQLEMDINTASRPSLLPGAKVIDLISEMADLSLEIADKGDIP